MQSAPSEEPKKQDQPAPGKEPKKQDQPAPQPAPQEQPALDILDFFISNQVEEPKKQDQPAPQPAPQEQPALDVLDFLTAQPKPGYKRLMIDFSPSTAYVLGELALGKGGSIGDALRDAIALSKWFKDTREEGGRILVERNGKLHEVITIKYPPDK